MDVMGGSVLNGSCIIYEVEVGQHLRYFEMFRLQQNHCLYNGFLASCSIGFVLNVLFVTEVYPRELV